MTYHYLASPYTHPELDVMDHRYEAAMSALNYLLQCRMWTYSPIVHCHELAKTHHLPRHAGFWRSYNRAMLDSARSLIILTIDGWDDSVGVADEMKTAKRLHLPTSFLHPNGDSYTLRSVK
jgi:hypothetical protein